MMRARLLLCWVYGAIALLALTGTWSQNVSYFHPQDGWLLGFVLATGRFWPETLATPASTSITVDLGLFFLAAAIFMVVEARRLDIRLPWLYVILGLLIAISVTFPLFLIARERRLGAQADVATPWPLAGRPDRARVCSGVSVIFSLWTITRLTEYGDEG